MKTAITWKAIKAKSVKGASIYISECNRWHCCPYVSNNGRYALCDTHKKGGGPFGAASVFSGTLDECKAFAESNS